MQIRIPTTIEEAAGTLGGIEALLTAKGWERAAIVYAFTRDGEAGRPGPESVTSDRLTSHEFAALGIKGLESHTSVRRYRAIWAENGTTPLSPGDPVELPTLDFPPIREGSRKDELALEERVRAEPPHVQKEIVNAVLAQPEVQEAFEVDSPARDALWDSAAKTMPKIIRERKPIVGDPSWPPDRKLTSRLHDLHLELFGVWEYARGKPPESDTRAEMVRTLRRLIQMSEALIGWLENGEENAGLMDEINAYLKEIRT